MKTKNRFKSVIAAFVLFTLLPIVTLPSSAMQPLPPTNLDGSDASGAQMPIGSSVVIENQSITFDLNDFPVVDNQVQLENYNGRVHTEYTLYNPTQEEITLKIALPLPGTPSYQHSETTFPNPTQYSVKVDGRDAEVTLRHAFNGGDPNPHEGFSSLLSDEYLSNEFCSPDMTVTKYTFKQNYIEGNSAYASFEFYEDDLKESCLNIVGFAYKDEFDDGRIRFSFFLHEEGAEYEMYVFGKDLPHLPKWTFYNNYSLDEKIQGKMDLVSKESMTLLDYVLNDYGYDEELNISELDRFNIVANELSGAMKNDQVILNTYSINNVNPTYISTGYTYEISIAPGERVVNTIDAPIYPTVETKYDPHTYFYSYLLFYNNAPLFSGKIDVRINTPYYMIENSSTEFEKTENGYSASFNATEVISEEISTTAGSVFFTLCEVEEPDEIEQGMSTFWTIVIIILVIIFGVIILVVELVKLIIKGIKFVIGKVKEWIK